MIGCDTSHAIAFTKILNRPDATGPLAEVRVVAAYPGGSADIPSSRDRVEGHVAQLREMGITIVDTIEALLPLVDVVLLESVDGRVHRQQAEPVIAAGKPLFVDKPLAGSLADALDILQMASDRGVPCFSCSPLRFSPDMFGMRNNPDAGDVVGCAAFSPCPLEPHHPDLYWYGIHGVETLFTIMGAGCHTVTRIHTDGTDVVIGTWRDGRIGTFRGIRTGHATYGALVFGSKAIVRSGDFGGYEPLVEQIARFFVTGTSPVAVDETIEIMAFMAAADESRRRGGAPVTLEAVLAEARATVQARRSAPARDGG
ncbi:MAG: dehydrogenase [Planctomycetes bacterium RBG_16_64_10]|nr:MAG: dehydrogenase [Planctomycetes bacterium RBG_16_64_10]